MVTVCSCFSDPDTESPAEEEEEEEKEEEVMLKHIFCGGLAVDEPGKYVQCWLTFAKRREW